MNDRVIIEPATSSEALEKAAALLGQADDDLVFGAVLEAIAQICGAEQVSLLAIESETEEPQLLVSQDALGRGSNFHVAELPSHLVEQALDDGEPRFARSTTGAVRGLVLPLHSAGRAVGVIYATFLAESVVKADLTSLVSLATLAALALERANLRASLEAAERARREFVSLTTHQLRVPLTSISGYTDLMLSGIAGPLTDRQEQFMRTAQRNVDRMTLLISDLSDLNRIEDGRMPLSVTEFDLKELIESVLQEQAKRLESRGHELQLQLPDDLPVASGDRTAVKRIFDKILDNAICYTPEGGKLTVVIDDRKEHLQVTVADNGIGIDEEDQSQLFVPFFRSEDEAVREHVGWGLSLALAKALLQAQGGELWCESELGTGAAFHFKLPVASTNQPFSSAAQKQST